MEKGAKDVEISKTMEDQTKNETSKLLLAQSYNGSESNRNLTPTDKPFCLKAAYPLQCTSIIRDFAIARKRVWSFGICLSEVYHKTERTQTTGTQTIRRTESEALQYRYRLNILFSQGPVHY